MRGALYLVLGWMLGAVLVLGSANVSAQTLSPPNVVNNTSGGLLLDNLLSQPMTNHPSTPGGTWRGGSGNIGVGGTGIKIPYQTGWGFTPAAIAKGAWGVAKFLGPSIALNLALTWVWDEVSQQWKSRSEEDVTPGSYDPVLRYSRSGTSIYGWSGQEVCTPYTYSQTTTGSSMGRTTYAGKCLSSGGGQVADVSSSLYCRWGGGLAMVNGLGMCTNVPACSSGYIHAPSGECVLEYQPLSQSQFEAGIEQGLVSHPGNAATFHGDVEAAGGVIQSGQRETTGPASVAGGTKTTTQSSPSGVTTTNNSTVYNITYAGDTITVNQVDTSTTTAPDGTTTTTTSGSGGGTGEVTPEEEQKQLCDEFPTASACAELGEPEDDTELPADDVDVSWSQEGGAAGSCPADQQFTSAGMTFALSYGPVCDAAVTLRPLVIAVAALAAAAFIFYCAGKAA